MPAQAHKPGRFLHVSVTAAALPADALARTVQSWLLPAVNPARYIVVANPTGDHADASARCDACAVMGKPRRSDNVRTSLRTALSEHDVSISLVRVHDGVDEVRRAAELLQAAPPSAVIRLQGWDEAELRAPAAVGAIMPEQPRLRWVTRSKAVTVLQPYVRVQDVFRGTAHKLPHGGVLCPLTAACDACQAFSNAAYDAVHVDVRAVLRAALHDGWDVSALYGTREMEQLQLTLEDWFRVTRMRPRAAAAEEDAGEPTRKRRRPCDYDF